ncbi:class I SAM-dependent methyltransferase [Piscirickettsia litoralis]|uniref:Ribosomal RNA small subunit methyltransferase J n=1 Tax=Piscirickettsia litoralis TaxID=1891921 RepID=A0ABX3A409_9GAMM|nr:class I SAM-dependent methyltransferase [Piscirickettsia litoralis]ODN43594.1 SAM-dependent methyltransferase [Piscirickettsia litoralis]
MTVAILIKNTQFLEKSQRLAESIKQPLVESITDDYHYYLVYSSAGLTLESNIDDGFKPLLIDFTHGKTAQRLQQASIRKEAIAKAFSLHKGKRPYILDCTAGLGRDAMLLAKLGCRVDMIERSPIVHALLADALERAREEPNTMELTKQVQLYHDDAQSYFEKHPNTHYDAIYLDPMFPEKKKCALAQKEMQLFKKLVGADLDAHLIFAACQNHYKDRLVIKRPRLAPLLAQQPSYQLSGKANRFDIYLTAS